jgi:hypothetical protein
MKQSPTGIDTGAIPSQQGLHCKGVTKAVEAGWINAYLRGKFDLWKKVMEGLANALCPQWSSPTIAKRKERIVRLPLTIPVNTAYKVVFDMLPKVRTEGHQSTFAELRLTNHEQMMLSVHIRMAEPNDLSHPQAKTVHQPEDERIDLSTMGCTRIVRQLCCYFQNASDLLRLEEKW